VLSTRWNWK